MHIAVREESSFSSNSIRETSNDSVNHADESVMPVNDSAEFSDDDEVPAGACVCRACSVSC